MARQDVLVSFRMAMCKSCRAATRKSYRAATRNAAAGMLLAASVIAPAAAAPFCVETMAVPPQCIYFDAQSCNARAAQMGGECSANPDELQAQVTQGSYCMVTSERVVSCIYHDMSTCNAEAKHEQAVCIQAQNRPEAPEVDPYRDIRPGTAGTGGVGVGTRTGSGAGG